MFYYGDNIKFPHNKMKKKPKKLIQVLLRNEIKKIKGIAGKIIRNQFKKNYFNACVKCTCMNIKCQLMLINYKFQ